MNLIIKIWLSLDVSLTTKTKFLQDEAQVHVLNISEELLKLLREAVKWLSWHIVHPDELLLTGNG
jgi:hypothetical protein